MDTVGLVQRAGLGQDRIGEAVLLRELEQLELRSGGDADQGGVGGKFRVHLHEARDVIHSVAI